MAKQNLSYGGGRLYFDTFENNTMRGQGLEYLGYTRDLSINVAIEKLEHWNLESKISKRDTSIIRQVSNTGQFVAEDLKPAQFARWLLTKAERVATIGAVVAAEKHTVAPGTGFILGRTDANPSGNRGIDPATPITIKNGATTYVAGLDYVVFPDASFVQMRAEGAYQAEAELSVGYKTADSIRDRVVAGSTQVRGCLFFVQDLAVGENHTILIPNATLNPNEAFNLKTNEWQSLGFTFDALEDPETGVGGVIIDGVAMAI